MALQVFKLSSKSSEFKISDNWNNNHQLFNKGKNEALVPVFYVDWRLVSFPLCQMSGLNYIANNDEYIDEYLCHDFFVGFHFRLRSSLQI